MKKFFNQKNKSHAFPKSVFGYWQKVLDKFLATRSIYLTFLTTFLVVFGASLFGVYLIWAHPAESPNPQSSSLNPYYIDGTALPDLDNCPAGPYGTRCYNEFGIEINCSNPNQADWNLDLEGNICDPCGNRQVNSGEDCDGTNLGGSSCQSLGFLGGTLACDQNCHYDTSGCHYCGNNTIDIGEECDLDNLDGNTCQTIAYNWRSVGYCLDTRPNYPVRCDPAIPSTWAADCGDGVPCVGGLACYDRSDIYCQFDACNCCGDGCIGSYEFCDDDQDLFGATTQGDVSFREYMLANNCLVCGSPAADTEDRCWPEKYFNCALIASTAGLPLDPTKYLWISETSKHAVTQMVALESDPVQKVEIRIPAEYGDPAAGYGGGVDTGKYLCEDLPAPWGRCVTGGVDYSGRCEDNDNNNLNNSTPCNMLDPASWPTVCGSGKECIQANIRGDIGCGQCKEYTYFRVGDVVHEYQVCNDGTAIDIAKMYPGLWPDHYCDHNGGNNGYHSPSRTAVNVESGEAWVVYRSGTGLWHMAHFHEDYGLIKGCVIAGLGGNGGGAAVDADGNGWIGGGQGGNLYKFRGGVGYCGNDPNSKCDPHDDQVKINSDCRVVSPTDAVCHENNGCDIASQGLIKIITAIGFPGTYGLAITPSGALWVSNHDRNGITYIADPDATTPTFRQAGIGLFGNGVNYGIGTDTRGNAYVTTFSPSTGVWRVAEPGGGGTPLPVPLRGQGSPSQGVNRRGVGIDKYGAMWVATFPENIIERISNSVVVDTAGGAPYLGEPFGVSGDSAGYVWAINYSKPKEEVCRFIVQGENSVGRCFTGHISDIHYSNSVSANPYMYSDFLGMNRAMTFRKRTAYYPALDQPPIKAFDLTDADRQVPQVIINDWRYRWGKIKYFAIRPQSGTFVDVWACFSNTGSANSSIYHENCPANADTTGWILVDPDKKLCEKYILPENCTCEQLEVKDPNVWLNEDVYNCEFKDISDQGAKYRKQYLRFKVNLRSETPEAEPDLRNLRITCEGTECD